MSYDPSRGAPSPEAHFAAAAADSIIESLLDGFQLTDALVAFGAAPAFAEYAFAEGISKGETISRFIQVFQLLERDNALFANAIPQLWDGDDEEPTG